ncbi:PASTA domain-containing protein [Bacteroides sp. 224]|uniref:PASTA domain-containing protein n=1 Tax=Bacteroides sp. 224 TaxID=2302936 RepID=UPI0013CF53E2|nr:PASTA domain-containing protein [Bacteroides sp. 224]NDV66281.1 PASTA domain-containing protein [Bacteroides sp. 224]
MTLTDSSRLNKAKFFGINILVMLVVIVLSIYFVFSWMDSYTRHGQAIEVPDAKGLSVRDASILFREAGLQCLVSDSIYAKEKPAGSVLEHSPSSGQRVKKDRIIYLTVNTRNVPLQLVPDVADNSSHRQAEARILAAGFKLSAPELITGERDWVYAIKYNGKKLSIGEKAPIGATLTLVVGSGVKQPNDSLETEEEPVVDDSWF